MDERSFSVDGVSPHIANSLLLDNPLSFGRVASHVSTWNVGLYAKHLQASFGFHTIVIWFTVGVVGGDVTTDTFHPISVNFLRLVMGPRLECRHFAGLNMTGFNGSPKSGCNTGTGRSTLFSTLVSMFWWLNTGAAATACVSFGISKRAAVWKGLLVNLFLGPYLCPTDMDVGGVRGCLEPGISPGSHPPILGHQPASRYA